MFWLRKWMLEKFFSEAMEWLIRRLWLKFFHFSWIRSEKMPAEQINLSENGKSLQKIFNDWSFSDNPVGRWKTTHGWRWMLRKLLQFNLSMKSSLKHFFVMNRRVAWQNSIRKPQISQLAKKQHVKQKAILFGLGSLAELDNGIPLLLVRRDFFAASKLKQSNQHASLT